MAAKRCAPQMPLQQELPSGYTGCNELTASSSWACRTGPPPRLPRKPSQGLSAVRCQDPGSSAPRTLPWQALGWPRLRRIHTGSEGLSVDSASSPFSSRALPSPTPCPRPSQSPGSSLRTPHTPVQPSITVYIYLISFLTRNP